MRTLPVTLLCLALAALPASADRLWLKNGNYLDGEVEVLGNGMVQVRSTLGVLSVSEASIERIERTRTVEQTVRERLAEAGVVDAELLFELARWSADQGAETLSRRLLEQVLVADPDHVQARRMLGYRLFEGQWVTADELHELRGEVRFRGEWMARETRDDILRQEASQAQAADSARRDAALQTEIALLRMQVQQQQQARYDYPYYLGTVWPQPVLGPIHPPRPSHPIVGRPPTRPIVTPLPTPTQPPVRHHRGGMRPVGQN